ncbi:MAG: DinB family protein [Gemmatimonadota bacterium]
MNESQRIADQMRAAFDGDTWSGRSIRAIVEDLTAARAAARPVAGAHSAWELLLHIKTWLIAGRRRLDGEAYSPSNEQNFPTVTDQSEAAWRQAWTDTEREYRGLADAIEGLPDARLDDIVPGRTYSVYHLGHGLIQHSLYHAGQIALLAKAG